ncbi:MAG: fatty acid CoA ligase family protein [Verrucomicrobiota bacterium]
MGSVAPSTEPVSNVARFLPEAAAHQPDFPAVRFPVGYRKQNPPGLVNGQGIAYETLTFAELERQANASATLFAEKGIQRGTRVLLMVKPGRDLILSVFALFKMGAVPVVIDPGMGRKHFLSCVRRTQPEAIVGIPLAQWLSRLFWKDFSALKCRATVGTAKFGRQITSLGETKFEPAATTVDELAAILFTSGSTGPPKGVCYEHGMFEAQVRMIRDQYAIEPGEVDLPMLPIFALFNPALGMTTVVPKMNPSKPATVNPAEIVQAIHQNQVTNSFGSPVLWNRIATYCEEKQLQLPSLKRILMAGAAAPPSLIKRMKALLPNGEIHTPYGATEVLPVGSISGSEILADTQQLTEQGKGVCVGRPLPEVSAQVIEIQDGPIGKLGDVRELPLGQIGEIVVTGPSVTKAYDALPEATAKAKIIGQGTTYHRMGDLGYFDRAGRLWFCGRMAEHVVTDDGPLYTECVEAIFNRHKKVFRSALVGIGQPPKTPCIVIEPEPDEWPQSEAARSTFTKELLAMAASNPLTQGIKEVRFKQKFPVDVRHNAKIHRLSMAREFSESGA